MTPLRPPRASGGDNESSVGGGDGMSLGDIEEEEGRRRFVEFDEDSDLSLRCV